VNGRTQRSIILPPRQRLTLRQRIPMDVIIASHRRLSRLGPGGRRHYGFWIVLSQMFRRDYPTWSGGISVSYTVGQSTEDVNHARDVRSAGTVSPVPKYRCVRHEQIQFLHPTAYNHRVTEGIVMAATTIAANSHPLRFAEIVTFRGDFGNDLVNPKGVAYHPALDRVIVTITPHHSSGRSLALNAVTADGARDIFANGYHPYRDVESMLVVVPPGPPVNAGFIGGDIYVNRGPAGQISRLSQTGAVLAEMWVDLNSNGLWGGICFDTAGTFNGRLVALDNDGKIFLVDAQARKTLLVDLALKLNATARAEGVTVAPQSFGPLGGQIIVGIEGAGDDDAQTGKVYAVAANGNPTLLADIGYTAEHVIFVPPMGGAYYQAELSFERPRENRLWCATPSQFLARAGKLLVINEMAGDLWEVAWDGARYTQSYSGRVPGRWSSEGLSVQGTELEGGDFAQHAPSLPGWTDWLAVPGGGTTDLKPNASIDASNNLHLFAHGINDGRVYMQSMWGTTEQWTGWIEMPGGLTTSHSFGSALHEGNLRLFAVRGDGVVVQKRVFIGTSAVSQEPWTPLPGVLTDAAVTAAVGTGRLVACAKALDGQLYFNELAVGERSWSGWSVVPGAGHTNANSQLVPFQDELYLLIKGLNSDRILVLARSAEGTQWTEWAEVPGGGRTDQSVAATYANGQCYVFVKGLDNTPYLNVSSNTGTWSGWRQLPNPGTTDKSLAATAIGSRVYLFAKGINDRQLYMRRTT
jgi:hypothetical protein